MHDILLEFWQLFANERTDVAGGAALRSDPVPLSFANGVWLPDPARLAEVAAWCHRAGMPTAIMGRGDTPPPAIAGAPRLEVGFDAPRVEAAACEPGADGADPIVEQIGWQQCRPMAELFARKHDRMDVEEELSLVLARALQRDERLLGYLAYDDDRVVAAGLALITGRVTLAWLEGEHADVLLGRLAREAPAVELRQLRLAGPAAASPPTIARWVVDA